MTQATEAPVDGQASLPKLWQVVVMALIAVAFTAVFMAVNAALHSAIWANGYVMSNRWTIPVGVLLFSLLVGLTQKYLRAPTVIEGGVTESLKGKGHKTDYRTFPGALASSFCSLLSGASVGPEGPVTVLVSDLAAWFRDKLDVSPKAALGFDVAALASALNGIIGNPLFTGVFATEYEVGAESGLQYLVWNLLAGVIGFSFYALLGLSAFAGFLAFAPVTHLELGYFVWAIVLGVVGAVLAIFTGASMQLFGRVVPRLFGERVVLRTLGAGVVISVAGLIVPELLFSGEDQIHAIVANPARYGVATLLLLAVAKLLLLGLAFKSGYLGGPTFPILFSCTMLGLALGLLYPTVPISLLVLCIESPALALALNAPLTGILLVAVIGTSDPDTIALMVLSTVVGLLVGAGVKQAIVRRATRTVPATRP
ncbi:MAG: chloride channel protein [Chloroflexi bacterium]|nr:chloride channel protein [Chloroflexota bacterium]